MQSYHKIEQHDLKRRRRERYIIAFLLILISALAYFGINLFDLGLDLPVSNSILIFALIDINIILLLLLLFLTLRNLVKLIFERKKKIMGSKLRSKLVLAFILLSLLPTIILFVASAQFISASIEYWSNLPVEKALQYSVEIGQEYYDKIVDELLMDGHHLSRLITYNDYTLISRNDEVDKLINDKRIEYRLAAVKVFTQALKLRASSQDERIDFTPFNLSMDNVLNHSIEQGKNNYLIQASPHGDLVTGIVPVFSRTETKAVVGLIVLDKFVPGAIVARMDVIKQSSDEYKQFKMLKSPLKLTYLIMLAIVSLLTIFASIWFGFFLSKSITVPIQELAEGTHRIAGGDYDFSIDIESSDEIGVLVDSFNKMTHDLKTGKVQLDEANKELLHSNVELDQRRLYMEIVLANVAAGVISVDAGVRILTVNKSAEKMLNIKATDMIGKDYRQVLRSEYLKIVEQLFEDKSFFKKGFIERQIKITVANKTLSLLVTIAILRDDRAKYLGLVAVLEDLTEIERAQRMAAWGEVARRIAHEVKNPLTPIQLSAQRLQKRYRDKIAPDDSKVFDECTKLIIDQVEELKRLVNEFSRYARLPTAVPSPNNLKQIVNEVVSLYKQGSRNVRFIVHDSAEIPIFKFDREEMKRALINLVDNAMDAIDSEGEIVIDLAYDPAAESVRIEIADNGKGIPAEHKNFIFEPYFSTKKHGTGLGLDIVNTIISEHNGTIRAEENKPRGSRFIIELPVIL